MRSWAALQQAGDVAKRLVDLGQRHGHRPLLMLGCRPAGPFSEALPDRVARGPDRSDVEHWSYATYEVRLSPGKHVLEALACGTPVVANVHSALPEVLGTAGRAAATASTASSSRPTH